MKTARRIEFENRLRRRYGRRSANQYLLFEKIWDYLDVFRSASLLYTVDALIISGSGEELKQWRDARASSCFNTGVVGAVFAQMSITALSLPSIRTAHWVAQGFFVVTLSYGVLSVRSSIEVQARLSSWSNVKEIRSRLSFRRVDEAKGIDCTGGAIDPALDIAEPGQYTRMAALSFYLGLGVYLGTVWTSGGNNVPGPNDSRNIFLCFISVIASEIVKWVFLSLLTLEDYEKQQEEEESTETVPEGSKKAEQPLHPA